MEPRNPFRCFDRRYAIEVLIQGVVLFVLVFASKRFAPGTAPRITFGVAEAIVFAWMIVVMLLRLRLLDELQQRIHMIAMALAFGLGGILIGAVEFLAAAGARVPTLGVWLWCVMVVTWAAGVVIIARRYR